LKNSAEPSLRLELTYPWRFAIVLPHMTGRSHCAGLLLIALMPGLGVEMPAQTALASSSPFLAAGAAGGGAGPGSGPAFELAGGIVTSSGSEVCIYDINGKRSHWIGVGDADGRIQVLSYDSAADRAVVRVDGVEQTLDLRKETTPRSPASAVPFVAAVGSVPGALPPGMSIQEARKQREARMLVMDLMDAGMKQRQAREEALRQAARNGQ
jgi:hypothetical protein